VLTVDGFCKNSGTGRLSHTSWSAEEIGMRQFSTLHRIFQRGGQSSLSNDGIEGVWTVFTCRDNIFFHNFLVLPCKDMKKNRIFANEYENN
jgi:hypothetical protein